MHEISGVVPGGTIDNLLRTMAVEPEDGVDKNLGKGGFEAVRKAVKGVIREGWSAGQVLEQVSRCRSHATPFGTDGRSTMRSFRSPRSVR